MQSPISMWLVVGFCASLLSLPVLCGSTPGKDSGILGRASIRPSVVRLAPGATQQFRVVLAPRWLRPARVASTVAWAVNGIAGGDERVGTIDRAGVYHAPAKAPRPNEVHVCATAGEASNRHLWATALVGAARPAYRLVAKWEEPADGSQHLKQPWSIAIEPDGNVLVVDLGCSKVFRYSPTGAFLGAIGGTASGAPRAFETPRAIAVDKAGNIVVGDLRTGPPRIQVFDKNGKYLHAFAEKGIEPGQVMMPQAMAFDPSGRLLTADIDNMRVTVFRHDGTVVETWQRNGVGAGELNEPYGVVVDANGDVFVPGYYGPCQKFTGKGEFLFAFAHADPPRGPVALTSAAGDRWGDVFMAVRDTAGLVENYVDPEPKTSRILKYNNNGDLVASIPLWDDERCENPMAVGAHDRLYVAFKRGKSVGIAVFEPR